MPLKPVHARDGITTTVITSRGDGTGDISKSNSGSEQSLVSNTGRITQSTQISQKVEQSQS